MTFMEVSSRNEVIANYLDSLHYSKELILLKFQISYRKKNAEILCVKNYKEIRMLKAYK